MPISWNQFMKWANSCVHKHLFMNSITHESWLWIQSQCTKCWGTAYFTAYYSIELYIKFKKFYSFTSIISWICLCCINRGYYNFMIWRMHEIHSINIVIDIVGKIGVLVKKFCKINCFMYTYVKCVLGYSNVT